jgi:DUF4097 and DUF4098 domain-containing protein YvlB
MREEVQRIIKLVQEGKLSAEDAAELIDAFSGGQEPISEEATQPAPPKSDSKDPFRSIIEAIEKAGKEVTENVDFQQVAKQMRDGTQQSLEAIKKGFEQVAKGKFDLGWLGVVQTKDVELPLLLPTGKRLRIENPLGDVRVSGGYDKGTIHAHANFKGAAIEELKERANAYTLIVEESEHEIVIRQPDVVGLHVDVDVQLNSNGDVEIRCESGDIAVIGTGGGARISSKSGDVQLKGLAGLVEVSSASGDVSLEDCTASSVSIDGKSGDLNLNRVSANITARTASGDINLKNAKGKTLSVESVSGDVNADLEEPISGTVSIRTVNGDAKLAVPDGGDCRVTLSTLRGDVACSLVLEDESRAEQRVSGKLGNGTGTLDISAVTGDVRVEIRTQAYTSA